MAYIRVSVRADVKRKLDKLKRAGETYSDVIERFVAEPARMIEALDYLEKHRERGPDTLGPRLRRIRSEANKSFEKRWKRLEKQF